MNYPMLTIAPVTMTSREIADLVEKRHDNVKRTIDDLKARGLVHPQSEDGHFSDLLGRPRSEAVYRVGKRDSHVIVAQLSPEFTARLVDRWQELEAAHAAPATLSRMDILRLAMESEQARIAAEGERDQAIATKAQIGSRREATAMAKASAAVREVNRLKGELGRNQQHATIVAVEKATGQEYMWRPLKKWCDEHHVESVLVPDARYGQVKAWPAEAWGQVYGVDLQDLFPVAEAV